MINAKLIDDLASKLTKLVPESAKTLQEDLEKNLRVGLQSTLRKMDLVTREEFEVQAALLSRCQERLKTLEKQVQTLEQTVLK